jgi:hypothetical protein
MGRLRPADVPRTIAVVATPPISSKTLELAASAVRAASLVDFTGAGSAAKAFRDLHAKSMIDLGSVMSAAREVEKARSSGAVADAIRAVGRQNTVAISQALAEINATNAAAVREAFRAADFGADWRADVAETMKALNLSKPIRDQIAASMQEVSRIPRAELATHFVTAVAEAEAYADLPQVREVASPDRLARLSASQRRTLQGAVLVALSEVATAVAAAQRRDPVGAGTALLALLATLLVIHQALSDGS